MNDNGDPNILNSAGFHFTRFDHAMDHVVLPLRQRLAARGETLTTYLSGLFDPEALDYRSNPAEYGEFVLALYLHMQQKYGWVPDAVEIGNEPDGQNVLISPEQMGPMVVAAAGRLQQHGFTPRFIVPSVVALRTFSMSTGLDASTVTPGRTAPEASLVVPAIDACANTDDGSSSAPASTSRRKREIRITPPPR